MATIHVSQLEAVRLQDVVGLDEASIFLGGQEMGVWPMSRGQTRTFTPHLSKTFTGSIVVELKEKNGLNKYKPLGSTTVMAGVPGAATSRVQNVRSTLPPVVSPDLNTATHSVGAGLHNRLPSGA